MEEGPIYFNSKCGGKYKMLSNFYGGVEIEYMKKRFTNVKILRMMDDFLVCEKEKFIFYLKMLQPGKEFTEKKTMFWFSAGEPIRGILAKLVGAIAKSKQTSTIKRRIKAISEYLELDVAEVMQGVKVNEQNDMMDCLRNKFKKPEYRHLLSSTESRPLHELPMKGNAGIWTYNKKGEGGDMLGKLLGKIRTEINLKRKRSTD